MDSAVVYDPAYLRYDFGAGHPFSPKRWALLVSLLEAFGLPLDPLKPAVVDDDVLGAVHTSAYLHAVASASVGGWVPAAHRHGLGTSDVPVFSGMDEAARIHVGGTLRALQAVADGSVARVLQLGGGLHHALPDQASGFCVYNDLSVGIAALRRQGLRVAYVDVDVHHGDGVQWIHYADPGVLTVSLHESGHTLFPGTGFTNERGTDEGLGSVVNLPLVAGTGDAGYLHAFRAVVPLALERFRPDVMLVQAGADAHVCDPLAHLALTTHGFEQIFRHLLDYAEQYAGGRMAVTLGGGYNLDATLRVWAILTHLVHDVPLPERLPEAWHTAQGEEGLPFTPSLHDDPALASSNERADHLNLRTIAEALAAAQPEASL